MATLAAPIFLTSTLTTSTVTGPSLKQLDTGSNSSSLSWTWKTATACQGSVSTTLFQSMMETVRWSPCWDDGAGESDRPPLSQRVTSCWWCWAQTETKLTEGSLLLILVVNALSLCKHLSVIYINRPCNISPHNIYIFSFYPQSKWCL